ncbi:hypothetical protein QOZ80_8BG0641830 [Eleusine coracana subsp. coracana]|nr:hypothetical protein QOZ80_8BG0641830 [Eleusine coracana subsp. coracana]
MAEPSSSSIPTSSSSSPSSSTHHQRVAGRELQGPRPAPLSVRRRDSDKKKMRRQQQHPQQVRQPVIIYTVSPRVVHAEPREFMSVVQRLTGLPPPPPPAPAPETTTTIPSSFFSGHPSAMAPQMQFPFQLQHHHQQQAARLAAIHQQVPARNATTGVADDVGGGQLPPLPSILSPVPGSLPAVPPSFFSPPPAGAGAAGAGSGINLFGELISPAAAFHGATTSQFYPTTAPSPSGSGPYYWDLFNHHHHQNNNL